MQETSKPAPPARPVPPNVRPPRPRLPFEKGPTDLGSWAYEHRVGLCCMIIAYLAFGIVFVSVKIAMNQERVEGAMYIDLTDMQQALETLQQQVPEQQDEGDDFSNVKNRISDENGRSESVGRTTASTAGGGASSSKSIADFMEGLDEEAAAVAGRVKASQDAFAKGRREEQEMIARSKAQREAKEGEKESGVKQKGSVLISYWLPGRRDVSLYMPAYQCEGGGEVTVNITVNRNGKVVSASMKESSTNSSCINDMAILAARNSRFNVDDTGSDKQSGTITYIFVPQ
ncbi:MULTISPECIES: energy transducer TonB [Alistipes]|uniref:Energy transducer TonB n=2 Tax=Alistipes TaxID=239759 RepID=A0ABR7CJX5_9BACT|nr:MULTISPECIES: energy transducer TonB [Alistipes]MBC5615959.1 energy transducer TonB [Alistipes hominis]MBS1413514.1 energy transducer TonB [Alistipes sp.]MDO5384722.1 energy transducer TonB [Rikenellaceae bacterium]